jgi:hypothetical protein
VNSKRDWGCGALLAAVFFAAVVWSILASDFADDWGWPAVGAGVALALGAYYVWLRLSRIGVVTGGGKLVLRYLALLTFSVICSILLAAVLQMFLFYDEADSGEGLFPRLFLNRFQYPSTTLPIGVAAGVVGFLLGRRAGTVKGIREARYRLLTGEASTTGFRLDSERESRLWELLNTLVSERGDEFQPYIDDVLECSRFEYSHLCFHVAARNKLGREAMEHAFFDTFEALRTRKVSF